MSRARSILLRYLVPGIVFVLSLQSWVSYQLSVRVYDDAPTPLYWYGGALSAWLNFPAFIYSGFAQPLWRHAIRLGRLRIEPRVIVFFVIVLLFWCWIGTRLDRWFAGKSNVASQKPTRLSCVIVGLAATLWAFCAASFGWELLHVLRWPGWRYLCCVEPDAGVMELTQLLWSVLLAVYFLRRLRSEFRRT